MKYRFIDEHAHDYPTWRLCRVMGVGKSSFYAWKAKPAAIISAEELHLYRRAKVLFEESRDSLGSRELAKRLRAEGITLTRHKMRRVMKKLNLVVKQRMAYKVTTKRKHRDAVADNLLNQNFNPVAKNRAWYSIVTGDHSTPVKITGSFWRIIRCAPQWVTLERAGIMRW